MNSLKVSLIIYFRIRNILKMSQNFKLKKQDLGIKIMKEL